MFVQSAKFVESHSGNINDISVYGQDSNPTTWKMAQMNLAIRGIDADLGKFNADTFFNDCHPTLRADFIMANPPFNLSDWGADKLADDVRWQYGMPPSGNANFAWLQHMIYHLAPNGRIGMVLANGSLSSQIWRRGRNPQKYHQRRSGGLHRGHAVPAVLYHADSRLPVVPRQEQAAEGQDPVHRRPQDGHHGDPQAAGADRRGYPQAGRHLQRLCGRHPGRM